MFRRHIKQMKMKSNIEMLSNKQRSFSIHFLSRDSYTQRLCLGDLVGVLVCVLVTQSNSGDAIKLTN